MSGRTSQNTPVHVDATGLRAGDLIDVEIVEGNLTHLIGRRPNIKTETTLPLHA